MVSNSSAALESLHMTHSLPLQGMDHQGPTDIIQDNIIEGHTFEVVLKRNSLGLGLSVTGGPEAVYPWTNYIRVKKVFPMQPAWESGQFQEGDVLISAGGKPLSGLTLRQALDVLRSSPPVTTLVVCRPYNPEPCLLVPSQKPSKRIRSYSFTPASIQHSLSICDENNEEDMDVLDANLNNNYGEFVVVLKKINGSLGFSLRSDPEDTTALRHSVKALVKEPAISDGRIRPGDKLISANGQECCAMSHSDLIVFLRSLPESVTLKFYRDASRAQTPISTPTESDFSRSHPNLTFLNSSFSAGGRSKQLRHEAKEMVRSLQASRTSLDGAGLSASGSRKLNRPFSPCLNRKQHYPLSNSSSSPFVMRQYSDDHPGAPYAVELPLSPDNPDANPFVTSLSISDADSLQIEEIQDDEIDGENQLAMEIETMIEDFEEVFKDNDDSDDTFQVVNESIVVQPNRPNHLDLFSAEKYGRTAFSFKNPRN